MIRQNGKDYLLYVLPFTNNTWCNGEILCVAYGNGAKPTASDMTYQICKSEARESTASVFGGDSIAMEY